MVDIKKGSKHVITWGNRFFKYHASQHGLHAFSTPIYSNLANLLLAKISSDKNLLSTSNNTEDSHPINIHVDGKSFVLKRILTDRVPNIFHEAFISQRLLRDSINAPEVIAIITSDQGVNYLVMREIFPFLDFESLLKNKIKLTNASNSFNAAYELGRSMNALLKSGVIHDEFDLKNCHITIDSKRNQVVGFHDFERTKYISKQLKIENLLETYSSSIKRRIARHSLTEAQVSSFHKGLFSTSFQVTANNIASAIEHIRNQKGQKRQILITIDGHAASGKSVFGRRLNELIPESVLLQTDWFVKYDRKERENTSISHYDWYDHQKIKKTLMDGHNSDGLYNWKWDKAYNHSTGRRDLKIDTLFAQNSIVILEGMYAFEFSELYKDNISFLLEVDHPLLMRRMTIRDTTDRGVDRKNVVKRFNQFNSKMYETYYKRIKKNVDVEINSSEGYQITNINFKGLIHF